MVESSSWVRWLQMVVFIRSGMLIVQCSYLASRHVQEVFLDYLRALGTTWSCSIWPSEHTSNLTL